MYIVGYTIQVCVSTLYDVSTMTNSPNSIFFVCVCVCVCVRARACVRACVRVFSLIKCSFKYLFFKFFILINLFSYHCLTIWCYVCATLFGFHVQFCIVVARNYRLCRDMKGEGCTAVCVPDKLCFL